MEDENFVQSQIRKGTVCPYCRRKTKLISVRKAKSVYAKTDYIRVCNPCNASVSCHPGTKNAMGRLANADLRRLRVTAHIYFDALWKFKMGRLYYTKYEARNEAYVWLAEQLGIDPENCHIAYFGKTLTSRTIKLCKTYCEQLGI